MKARMFCVAQKDAGTWACVCWCLRGCVCVCLFFQAGGGVCEWRPSRVLGDVYKRQALPRSRKRSRSVCLCVCVCVWGTESVGSSMCLLYTADAAEEERGGELGGGGIVKKKKTLVSVVDQDRCGCWSVLRVLLMLTVVICVV